MKRTIGTVAFWLFFVGYAGWCTIVLGFGVSAAVAKWSPGWHEQLHTWGFLESAWGRASLRMADASHDTESPAQLTIDYGFALLNFGLAAFLLWLRRGCGDWTARLLAVAMVGTAAVFNLEAHTVYETLDATPLESFTHDALHVIAAIAYVWALVLFPDGRLVPRWRRLPLAALYLGVAPALLAAGFAWQDQSRTVALIMLFGVVAPVAGVAAQAYRYRRASTLLERQQARLLFWALAPALGIAGYALLTRVQTSAESGFEDRGLFAVPTTLFRVFQAGFGVIPIALFIGLILYKLWDIDKVISRALVYSVLAGFVSAVYVAVVVGIGTLLGNREPGNIGLSIVATGIVAIAFQPVRDRVQRFADRLVYGQRATPYEVLSQFSEKVAETPATEEILNRMARILAEGTTARRADVWLAVGQELRPAASWPDAEDASTRPAPLPITGPEIPWIEGVTSAVAVRHQGELFGALSVTKPASETLTPTEEKLLADLGRQAGLVLRNVRLNAELLERLRELGASRKRLVAAQDEARRRLERNLHDGAQQQLVALKVQLALAEGIAQEMEGENAAALAGLLATLKVATGEALETLRDLARGIYPPLLAAEGLATALASHGRKISVPVDVQARDLGRYSQEVEAAVYFCCLEALQNIEKYAGASRVVVNVAQKGDDLVFSVRDDGEGFDCDAIERGAGTQNMADRISALGGTFELHSTPGAGTTVTGRIPVAAEVPATAPAPA